MRIARRAIAATAVSAEADQGDIGIGGGGLEFGEALPDQFAVFRYREFCEIFRQIRELAASVFAFWDELPTYESHKRKACERRNSTHRGKVKHPKRRAQRVFAD